MSEASIPSERHRGRPKRRPAVTPGDTAGPLRPVAGQEQL
jgi:hypothetical protein